MKLKAIILLLNIFAACMCSAQQVDITAIDKAINDNNIARAEALLNQSISQYSKAGLEDSLVNFIFYLGKTERKKSNAENAVKRVQDFVKTIEKNTNKESTIRQAYLEAAEFYGSVGKNKLAFEADEKAYSHTEKMPDKTPNQLGQVLSNMGAYAHRMGNIDLSKQLHRKALQLFLSDKQTDYERLYISYNNLGGIMYYASKLDSARYYYSNALQALEKTERTPVNQFYRPAVLQNNLAGVYSMDGQTTAAINAMRSTIDNLKNFLATKEPNPKKVTATTFQFEATDNLAGIYKELGNYKQAKELLEYSYRQKQKHLDKNDPGIFISQIILGQLYFAMNDADKAEQYLNTGILNISMADGDYVYYQADASNTLALLYDRKKEMQRAAASYEKADSLYYEALQGDYDIIYLNFLRNAALFYAENNQPAIALAKAKKSYDYTLKVQGPNTLETFYQLLNLANVYQLSGNYAEALQFGEKALATVNKVSASSTNLLDSIKIEIKKTKAILVTAKAGYALLKVKDAVHLTDILNKLNQALQVLERRKTIINDPQDIGLLMADHSELLEFTKKITFELYQLVNDQAYIDRLMSLQESSIYSRIRLRLDKNDSLQFSNVPINIRSKEKQLKAAISASLQGSTSHQQKMQAYFEATENWEKFLQDLKQNQPAYYRLRYESIFKPLKQIQRALPQNATLVRYFFIDKNLFVLVAENGFRKLVRLEINSLKDDVENAMKPGLSPAVMGAVLNRLFRQLWMPIAGEIRHKNVIIIPDGILYSLSFELLTPATLTSFKDLATKSLLASYAISYHYSLFLVGGKEQVKPISNFVAFTPGFPESERERFLKASDGLMDANQQYLSLLPQPFTTKLAAKIQTLLGGNLYMNSQSTKANFTSFAGNHKVIHIGTHAESNNEHPELSKLIFAKSDSLTDDNELFVHEIYNCDLSAQLAVLTGCETGKPGFQDGEGMISFAHAFNYAGSQSILTGLWKIDEKASAVLAEAFYKNLLAGMPKDEALQKAKLEYLVTENGRMLEPQYWAGLIIMGDTSALIVKPEGSGWWLLLPAIVLLMAGMLFFRFTKPISK